MVLALARPEVHELFPNLWQNRGGQTVALAEERPSLRRAVNTGEGQLIYRPFDLNSITGDLSAAARKHNLDAVLIVHPNRMPAFAEQRQHLGRRVVVGLRVAQQAGRGLV